MKLPEATKFTVLYVLAGKQRQCDIKSYLVSMALTSGIELEVREVDTERHQQDDVAVASKWKEIMSQLETGQVNVLLITPPCNT